MDAVQDPHEVDVHHVANPLERHFVEVTAHRNAGVVEKHVQASAARGGEPGKRLLVGIPVADVEQTRDDPLAERLGKGRESIRVDVVGTDEPALGMKAFHRGAADPARASGNEDRPFGHVRPPPTITIRARALRRRASAHRRRCAGLHR